MSATRSQSETEGILRCMLMEQTPDERARRITVHDNDTGFNQADAEFMTRAAEIVWELDESGCFKHLNDAWLKEVERRLRKYEDQIERHLRAALAY